MASITSLRQQVENQLQHRRLPRTVVAIQKEKAARFTIRTRTFLQNVRVQAEQLLHFNPRDEGFLKRFEADRYGLPFSQSPLLVCKSFDNVSSVESEAIINAAREPKNLVALLCTSIRKQQVDVPLAFYVGALVSATIPNRGGDRQEERLRQEGAMRGNQRGAAPTRLLEMLSDRFGAFED